MNQAEPGNRPSRVVRSFVAETQFEAIPTAVRDRLKLGFLAAISAAAIAGPKWSLPDADLPLARATARNAVAVHDGDPDPDPVGAGSATCAWCVPVVLTAATGRVPGADLLTAAAVGTELGLRLRAAAGDTLTRRGLDLSVTGTLAATAAAARLLGADPEQTGSALGIAACATPSALLAGWRASVARSYLAHAAGQAVTAVELALRGLRGLTEWIGPWFAALAPDADPTPITVELGDRWLVADAPDPSLAQARAVAARLAGQLRAERISPDEIESVVVHGGNLALFAGHATGADGGVPELVAEALAGAADGAALADVADGAALAGAALRHRVQVAGFGDESRVGMTARTTTGRQISAVAGDDLPATSPWPEAAARAQDRLAGVLGTTRAAELVDALARLEHLDDPGELTSLLATPGRGAAGSTRGRTPARSTADATAAALARFTATTTFPALPTSVVEAVKRSVLDAVGCALYGQSAETVALIEAYAARPVPAGAAAASVWHNRHATTATAATLVNGTAIHTTELSESFTRAAVHPGTSIVPAMLAVAQRERATGAETVTAIAVGYEVAIRLGLAFGGILLAQGLHSPTLAGAFGVAAGAARLRGLDEVATGHALAITACRIPSAMWAAAAQHAEVKDLFQAHAAALAIEAVDLAAGGQTGPVDWLPRWFAAIPRQPRLAGLADTLGTFWWVSSGGLHFKDLPVMAMAAPTLGALRQILTQTAVPPQQVARVVVESSGRISLNRTYPPQGLISARGSIPFLVAAILSHPAEFLADRYFLRFLTEARIADRSLDRLAQRVELRVDPTFDAHMERAWPLRFEARVSIELRGGQTLVGYDETWARTSTMSYDDVADKFRAMCADVLAPADLADIISQVRRLDQLTSVRDITAISAAQ